MRWVTYLPEPRVGEVSDGVFAYLQPDGGWWINKTVFLVGRDRVLGIDACSTERRTRDYLRAIRKVTEAPVRTLLNTHHHGDHTHGNGYFREATIIAHERTPADDRPGAAAERAGVGSGRVGELPPAPPFVTYTDGVDIWVDERRVEVRYIGTAAHTTNDSIAWMAEQRTAVRNERFSVRYASWRSFRGDAAAAGSRPVAGRSAGVRGDARRLARTTAGTRIVDGVHPVVVPCRGTVPGTHEHFPWRWQPIHVDEYFADRRSAEKPASVSTLRAQSGAIRAFCGYLTEPAYRWAPFCEKVFNDVPSQIVFD